MFMGQHNYSMDEKRRMSIPASMRKELGEKAVITRGIENCLVLYPLNAWKELAQKLQDLPTAKGETRGFVRIMLSGASEVSFDKLGRILVPDYLAKYADLEREVTIIGMINKIEIWEREKWEKYKDKTERNIGSMVEKLEELGI